MIARNGWHRIPLVSLLILLFGLTAQSQDSRDDWKYLDIHTDLLRNLPDSLEDAPLSKEERSQIYQQMVAGLRSDGLLEGLDADAERIQILAARVGIVHLAGDASKQFLVKASRGFCGSGGCPFWLFVTVRGQLQVALDGGAGALLMRQSTSQGFHDLVTFWHRGGGEMGIEVFRWTGRKYESHDCYIVSHDESGAAVISDCK